GIADRVRFTGHLPDGAYREHLAAADLFVLPSEWEAFGIVLLEAMACGVPCGDEAALAGAMGELLRAPWIGKRMGAAGRERAMSLFSWDAVADRTLAVYREVTPG